MASVRLTEYMRDSIKDALLERAFGERDKAIAADELKLADDIYKHLYPAPLLRKMKALPNGFLPKDDDQRCKFGGDFERVSWGEPYRIVAAENRNNAVVFDANHPFTDRYRDIKNRKAKLEEEKREARAKANAALKNATTVGKLLAIWPEVKPFVEKYLKKATTAAQLPVVQTAVLNKTFDLPVPPVKKVAKAVRAKGKRA